MFHIMFWSLLSFCLSVFRSETSLPYLTIFQVIDFNVWILSLKTMKRVYVKLFHSNFKMQIKERKKGKTLIMRRRTPHMVNVRNMHKMFATILTSFVEMTLNISGNFIKKLKNQSFFPSDPRKRLAPVYTRNLKANFIFKYEVRL